jgi:hypothetical protein
MGGPGKETAADKIDSIDAHIHGPQQVYPTLANDVALAAHANAWVLGTITEIIPASTIAENFDIHEVLFEDVNVQDKTYELVLYSGAGDVEVGRVRASSSTLKGGIPNGTMKTPIIDAGSRIRARLAVEGGGGKTVRVSLRLQHHPA